MRNADGWGALEVRHPRAFATVVDEGTFSCAARELGYTQSAVSQQIGALERIVGAPVLHRVPGGRVGHVSVRTFQSFGPRLLPGVLGAFRARCPGVEVRIEEALDVEALLGAVEERGLGDLDGRPLLGIRGCRHTRAIEMQMLAGGVAPESWSRFDNNAIIQALAAAGEGVAIVPELVVDAAHPGIDVHPLPELPARRLIAVWHRERALSAAAREFVDAAAEACA